MATNFFYQANKLLKLRDTSSFATRSERFKTIRLVDKELIGLGFKGIELKNMKPKHIKALVNGWKSNNLSPGTIKNRLSHLRWLAEKINKKGIIPRTNAELGIENRRYVSNQDKGKSLTIKQLNLITDQHVKMSLELQAAFGLRREEAIKIQPHIADRGDHLFLRSSWCKGGRDRTIPILNEMQRDLLKKAILLANGGSLIPKERSYYQQMKRYENECLKVGVERAHGLRHKYAHLRYFELTGMDCTAVSGCPVTGLSQEKRQLDHLARQVITEELGHGRLQVTAIYLGY